MTGVGRRLPCRQRVPGRTPGGPGTLPHVLVPPPSPELGPVRRCRRRGSGTGSPIFGGAPRAKGTSWVIMVVADHTGGPCRSRPGRDKGSALLVLCSRWPQNPQMVKVQSMDRTSPRTLSTGYRSSVPWTEMTNTNTYPNTFPDIYRKVVSLSPGSVQGVRPQRLQMRRLATHAYNDAEALEEGRQLGPRNVAPTLPAGFVRRQ